MGTNVSRSTSSTRELLDALRWLFQAIRESSRRAEREVGLSGAQLFVLQEVAEVPILSLVELARRTRTHPSSVSVVVSRLVRQRLVRRVRATADARRAELTLTARGRGLVARGPDVVQHRLIRAIERLPANRRRQLAASLGELARSVAATGAPPPMFFHRVPARNGRSRG